MKDKYETKNRRRLNICLPSVASCIRMFMSPFKYDFQLLNR